MSTWAWPHGAWAAASEPVSQDFVVDSRTGVHGDRGGVTYSTTSHALSAQPASPARPPRPLAPARPSSPSSPAQAPDNTVDPTDPISIRPIIVVPR